MYSKINASQFDPLHFNRLSLWDGDITGGIIEFYSCQSYCLYQWSTVTQTNGYHLSPTLQHFWKSQPGTIYNICNIYIFFPPRKHIFLFLLPHHKLWLFQESLWCWCLFCCMQFNCRRGATVHFSCDEGYELQGSKSISCLRVTDSYVGWSDDRPICRGKGWRVGCSSMLMCNGGWSQCDLHLYMFILMCPDVDGFACQCAIILCRCPVHFLLLFISLIMYLTFFLCDWPDFDPWTAFFCFLLFSHAGIVLPISHVFFILTILWQVGRAVRLPVQCSWCSCA